MNDRLNTWSNCCLLTMPVFLGQYPVSCEKGFSMSGYLGFKLCQIFPRVGCAFHLKPLGSWAHDAVGVLAISSSHLLGFEQ